MAKKTATIPLAGQVAVTRYQVTAAEVEAGLPTGTYGIIAAQAGLVGGIPAYSGFITSYYSKSEFQLQEFRSVWTAETWSRSKASAVWASWVKIGVGDTGWVDINSLRHADWAATTLMMRREGNRVTLKVRAAKPAEGITSPGSILAENIPAGFRAEENNIPTWAPLGVGALEQPTSTFIGITSRTTIRISPTTTPGSGYITWITTDAFPAPPYI